MHGNAGDDRLLGGAGEDAMIGGAGDDVYEVATQATSSAKPSGGGTADNVSA